MLTRIVRINELKSKHSERRYRYNTKKKKNKSERFEATSSNKWVIYGVRWYVGLCIFGLLGWLGARFVGCMVTRLPNIFFVLQKFKILTVYV